MALTVSKLKKTLVIEIDGKDKEVEYPDQNMTPEEAIKHLTPLYPQLTNANLQGPKVVAGKAQYKASTEAGTHG